MRTDPKNLPGRDILKQLVNGEKVSVNYEVFRNMLVIRMVEKAVKPAGMLKVIAQITGN
jgi:hypothetical protein